LGHNLLAICNFNNQKYANVVEFMFKHRIYTALGLMSGTSLDGIDAAIIKTDGHTVKYFGPFATKQFSDKFRNRLRAELGKEKIPQALQKDLTHLHANLVETLLSKYDLLSSEIDIIGFHGQTIHHNPKEHFTLQIGDGALLAKLLGISVVNNFRSADVKAGGQGAPLTPVYHRALAQRFVDPTAIVNIGGVANVSFISDGCLLAFDTGPGNALIDDLIKRKLGKSFDTDGRVARQGKINEEVLTALSDHSYFNEAPPKSLDRNEFDFSNNAELSVQDSAATLVAFTANAIVRSLEYFPEPPKRWLVTGGGRRNLFMMDELSRRLRATVKPVEDVGWNGDALEAQAFAFLAVRSILKLPLSFPSTTGVFTELTGGDFYHQ
jgi:anhydro-N-acetylmuramic acid kinase